MKRIIKMTQQQIQKVRALYKEFYKLYPEQTNPSYIDTIEKAEFLIQKGFEDIHLMQIAHKLGYLFTDK
jgi:hypothetical protein